MSSPWFLINIILKMCFKNEHCFDFFFLTLNLVGRVTSHAHEFDFWAILVASLVYSTDGETVFFVLPSYLAKLPSWL